MMLCALRMMAFSQAAIKVNSGSGDPKVSKGRSQTSSVLTALWSPPQRRNPCLRERPAMVGKTSRSVALIWRDNVELRERAAWGRSCGSAKLLAGTLRCLHLCWLLPLNWSPAEQLGRCPKPHKGRCPLTLQGALPLDPFFAPRLEHTCLIVRNCCPYPKSASRTRRCPGRHRAPPSPSNPVSDPHTRGLSPPESSHCPTISAGTSQF